MVLLGIRFSLLMAVPKRAHAGIYAGKQIMFGHVETFSGKKTKRKWKPNVQKKKYYSEVLEKTLSYNFTTHAMRCVDKAGGFDNYILNTKASKLKSNAAIRLQNLMIKVKERKDAGVSMDQIREEVYPLSKVGSHTPIVRTFSDRFYYDWKGPRKQVIFC